MTRDDPAIAALQRLEQAMDLANDLIGGLLRKVEEGQRPTLRVLSGGAGATGPTAPATPCSLRVVHLRPGADGEAPLGP